MKKPTVVVDVAPDGTTTISVHGVKGSACQDLTRELENELGPVESVELTKEFYEREQRTHTDRRITQR